MIEGNDMKTIVTYSILFLLLFFTPYRYVFPSMDNGLLKGIVRQKRSEKELENRWKNDLKKYPLSNSAIELEYQFSFPSDDLKEKEIFLWNPIKMRGNEVGQIFITDQKWRHIFQFDKKGNYLKTIGRIGQGPGEFMNPYSICVAGSNLVVMDNSNLNIQFFDFMGQFIDTQKIYKTYLDMTVDSQGQIYTTPLIISNESLLVDVFNEEGQYVRSIIESYMKVKSAISTANTTKIAMNSRGEILLAYISFPIICKYSVNGQLLKKWEIDDKFMRVGAEFNMLRFSGKIRDSKSLQVIYGMKASSKGGFYILKNYPRTHVLEFDKQGQLVNDYYYESYPYRAKDFIVDEKTGNIYLLQIWPEVKIDVFRPRKT